MEPITKEQAQQRFTALPPSLQDAVFSLHNTEIVETICGEADLTGEEQSEISRLVGLVLLGFLKIENLAADIEENAFVPLDVSKEISRKLNDRIFSPLRSDIEKMYGIPLDGSGAGPSKSGTVILKPGETAPRKISEIISPEKKTEPKAAVMSAPREIKLPFVSGAIPQPASLPMQDFTPVPPQQKFSPLNLGINIPAKPPEPAAMPPIPEIKMAPQTAPVILQEESEARPLSSS